MKRLVTGSVIAVINRCTAS